MNRNRTQAIETDGYTHALLLRKREDRVWNSAERRQIRVDSIRELLNGEEEAYFLVDGFTTLLPDLDIELLNRDLGWSPAHRLCAEVASTEKSAERFKKNNPGDEITPYFHIEGRVLPPDALWQERVQRQLSDGDFELMISIEGVLREFTIRKKGPQQEDYENGLPKRIRIRFGEGKDQIQLLDERYGADKVAASAEIADIVLALLRRRGPACQQWLPPSPGR